jgi:pimeloyl-ACP methyl ester carboxylesterase
VAVKLLAASAAALALLVPGGAGAATIPLAPCGQTAGLVCGTVTVPLDRTGAVPGTIDLHVEELPVVNARGTIFLLAGGPGQGSARTFDLGSPSSAGFYRFLFPDYTLVTYDDRGTGASGLLNCPTLQKVTTQTTDQYTALVGACADLIGSTRVFYSTAAHAEDLEAVRQALGLDPVGVFGVSYGTKLALAYALAHPDHVSRILLDSVLPTALPDVYDSDVLRAMPATLAAYCASGACRAATRNFAGEAVALANQLEAKPLVDRVLLANGRFKNVRIAGEDLIGTIIQADLSPGLAAELPAAIHAARTGYTRPLSRLHLLTLDTAVEPAADLSSALYAATTCDDGLFPWSPDAAVAERPALLQAAVAGLPAGTFGPFGNWAARTGTAQACLDWPSPAGGAPLAPGPLPDVPMLAISGGFDMRTPTASATAVATLFQQGHVLVVPGVGHSVLTTDLSLCSQNAVRNWVVGGSVPATCAPVAPLIRPLVAFPSAKLPAKKLGPAATFAEAKATIREATAAWLQADVSAGAPPVPGLYGGKLVPGANGVFTLTRYSIAPGVSISGTLKLSDAGPPFVFGGSVQVAGAEATPGTLSVGASAISGTLGGRRVSG